MPDSRITRRRVRRAAAAVVAVGLIATAGGIAASTSGAASAGDARGPGRGTLLGAAAGSVAAGSSQGATTRVVHRSRFRAVGKVAPPPRVRMRAWAIADMDTGALLTVHRHRHRLPQASTIKLLTAVTASERVAPRPRHRVTRAEAHPQYCTCAGLRVGRRYSRAALLTGMLLPSGNDAAEAIAGSDPHGHRAFIAAMNAKARRLGATDTHVVTPSGLTAAGAHSSARDLLVFLRAAQANRVVEPFLRRASGRVGPLHGRSHRVYRSTDYVNSYPIAQGKSGYTTPALNTLVVVTPRYTPAGEMHRIGVATLGAPSGYSTKGTRALTVWAGRNYDHLRPLGHLPDAPGPVVGAQADLATGD